MATGFQMLRRCVLGMTLLLGGCGVTPSLTAPTGCAGNEGCAGEETTQESSGYSPRAFSHADASDGIGTAPDPSPDDPSNTADNQGLSDTEEADTDVLDGSAQEAPPPETVPSTVPEFDLLADPLSVVDPSGLPALEPADSAELLSLWTDAVALDLIDPENPNDWFTYLEQLCRDSGASDSYCRQLYGE